MVGLLCVALAGVMIVGAIMIGRREAVRMVRQNMSELASNMASALDSTMRDRFREIQVIGGLRPLRTAWRTDPGQVREVLDTLQASLPAYTWIGFAAPDGTVLSSTKKLLEGASVAERPWFVNGLKAPSVGDVHDAKLLATVLRRGPDVGPFRFVDVSVPVRDEAGMLAGVLGAHLSWSWAGDLRQRLLSSDGAGRETEVWVLASDGQILLGPTLGAAPFDAQRLTFFAIERSGVFEDRSAGDTILTGFAVTSSDKTYPGLGWIVVSRRPVSVAYKAIDDTARTIVLSAPGWPCSASRWPG